MKVNRQEVSDVIKIVNIKYIFLSQKRAILLSSKFLVKFGLEWNNINRLLFLEDVFSDVAFSRQQLKFVEKTLGRFVIISGNSGPD